MTARLYHRWKQAHDRALAMAQSLRAPEPPAKPARSIPPQPTAVLARAQQQLRALGLR